MFFVFKMVAENDLVQKLFTARKEMQGKRKALPFSGLTDPFESNAAIKKFVGDLLKYKLGLSAHVIERDIRTLWVQLFPKKKMTPAIKQKFEVLYLLYVSIGGHYGDQKGVRTQDMLMVTPPVDINTSKNGGMSAIEFFAQKQKVGVCADLVNFYISAMLASGLFTPKELTMVHIEGADHFGADHHYIVQAELDKGISMDIDLVKAMHHSKNPKMFDVGFGIYHYGDFGETKTVKTREQALFEHWGHQASRRYREGHKDAALFYLTVAQLQAPKSRNSAYNLALVNIKNGYYQDALKSLMKTNLKDPFALVMRLVSILALWQETLKIHGRDTLRVLRPVQDLLHFNGSWFNPKTFQFYPLDDEGKDLIFSIVKEYQKIQDQDVFSSDDKDMTMEHVTVLGDYFNGLVEQVQPILDIMQKDK